VDDMCREQTLLQSLEATQGFVRAPSSIRRILIPSWKPRARRQALEGRAFAVGDGPSNSQAYGLGSKPPDDAALRLCRLREVRMATGQ